MSSTAGRTYRFDDILWVIDRPIYPKINAVLPSQIAQSEALEKRGIEFLSMSNTNDVAEMQRLHEAIRKTDKHVIIDFLALSPQNFIDLFKLLGQRGNYSFLTTDYWFHCNYEFPKIDFLGFRHYTAIAARIERREIAPNGRVPFWQFPDPLNDRLCISAAMLRPAWNLIAPFVDAKKARMRERDELKPGQLLYVPFTVSEPLPGLENLPLKYDVVNVSANRMIGSVNDPYVSAKMFCLNWYNDRVRWENAAVEACGAERVYNLDKANPLSLNEYYKTIASSKFVVVSGGLLGSFVPKFMEFGAVGTPMLGHCLPYDYPAMAQSTFHVEATEHSPRELRKKIREALAAWPTLKERARAVQEATLRLYRADAVIDMTLAQMNGEPIPEEYLTPAAPRIPRGQ